MLNSWGSSRGCLRVCYGKAAGLWQAPNIARNVRYQIDRHLMKTPGSGSPSVQSHQCCTKCHLPQSSELVFWSFCDTTFCVIWPFLSLLFFLDISFLFFPVSFQKFPSPPSAVQKKMSISNKSVDKESSAAKSASTGRDHYAAVWAPFGIIWVWVKNVAPMEA